MLPFALYCLNFFDISTIDHGFYMVFRDAWIKDVSPSEYNSSNSLLYYSSKRRSNANWWSFDLEYLESFCNNKSGISISALKEISFNGESWIHIPFHKNLRVKGKDFYARKQLYGIFCRWSLTRWYYPFATKDNRSFGKLLYRCLY